MKRHPALVPLSHQHHDALALCVFIARGLKQEPSDQKAQQLRAQATDSYEQLIKGHFEVEESVLFPLVRPHLSNPALLDELLNDHKKLTEAFNRLESATGDTLIESLKKLGSDLDRHIRSEERALFQAVQAEMDDMSIEALGRRIASSIQEFCPTQIKRPG